MKTAFNKLAANGLKMLKATVATVTGRTAQERTTLSDDGSACPRSRRATAARSLVAGSMAAGVLFGWLLAAAPAASAAVSGPVGPGVTQVGNVVLMAGEGAASSTVGSNNHSLVVQYQTVGSSSWSFETVAGAGTTYSRPEIVTLSYSYGPHGILHTSLIAVAAEGPNHTLDFYWQSLSDISSVPWHSESVGGPGTTFSRPSIAQLGNDVGIATEGAGNGLEFWWQQIGATGWNNLLEFAEVVGAPSLAELPGGVVGVAFESTGNYLELYAQNLTALASGAQPWVLFIVAGYGTTYSPPSLALLDGGYTAIAAAGPSQSLDFYYTNAVDGTTSYWPSTIVSNASYSAPSLVQLPSGVVGITSQGAEDTLKFYWENSSDGTWQNEQVGQAGADASQPPLALLTNSAGTNFVATAAESANDGVSFYWQALPFGLSVWNTEDFGGDGFA